MVGPGSPHPDATTACEALFETVTILSEPDRVTLLDLWVRAWSRHWPGIDFDARREWLANHLDLLLAEGAALLLIRDRQGAACGFLTVHPVTGAVDQLAVDPGAAGRGVGAALLREAQRIRPAGLHLAVNQGNDGAVRLYRRAGFGVVGTDTNPRSGLPVWLMRWPAPP